MEKQTVLWPELIRKKLLSFRSEYFSAEETHDFIIQLILETEDLLLNTVLSQTYTEEHGQYKGVSRIVIMKFRIFFEQVNSDIIILGLKFPGEV